MVEIKVTWTWLEVYCQICLFIGKIMMRWSKFCSPPSWEPLRGYTFAALRMNSGTFGVGWDLDQVSLLWLPVAPLGQGVGTVFFPDQLLLRCLGCSGTAPYVSVISLSFSRQVSFPANGQPVCCCHCWNACITFAFVCLPLWICYKAKTVTEQMWRPLGGSTQVGISLFLWRVYWQAQVLSICACPNG